jgi:hypothetical protein
MRFSAGTRASKAIIIDLISTQRDLAGTRYRCAP